MLTYDEMVEKTREFYDELQIDIPDKYIALTERSLSACENWHDTN